MEFDQQLAERFCSAETERALFSLSGEIAERLGANHFQALRFGSADHGKARDGMGSYPERLVATLADMAWPDSQDPVMQHLRASSNPLLWGRAVYEQSGPQGAHEYQAMADFGIRFGAIIALHLSQARHFVLGFSWPHRARPDARLLTVLQLYALYAEPAFYRVWSRNELAPLMPQRELTEREISTVYWSSRGFRVPDIAQMFGRSARTVEKFAQGAMEKLNAGTLTEAVSIAERLQLLESRRARDLSNRPAPRLFDHGFG